MGKIDWTTVINLALLMVYYEFRMWVGRRLAARKNTDPKPEGEQK